LEHQHAEIYYWASFGAVFIVMLLLLIGEPLFTKYKSWKMDRAFKQRDHAGRVKNAPLTRVPLPRETRRQPEAGSLTRRDA
jgi:hypothetical protein